MVKMSTSPVTTPVKKKKFGEEFSISSAYDVPVGTVIDNASMHGVVTRLSPMKQGKKSQYYEGNLTDGQRDIRLYGFNHLQHKQLQRFKESGESLKLVNCEVKKVAKGDAEKIELCVKPFSSIEESQESFTIRPVNKDLQLAAIAGMNDYEIITVRGEVHEIDSPIEVGNGLTKQDVLISDGVSSMKVTFWEENVGKVEPCKQYRFRLRYNMEGCFNVTY